ncbi:MAG: hypothetical protein ACTH6S_08920 [Mesonia sp.]|uniref:hypothetical protein n=1 Tax=Mesonia sp. TaxID=1960830 RepID=UPI003F959033
MKKDWYITSSVKLKNHQIFKNDALIFKTEPHISTQDFLKEAYRFLEINYPKFHKMDVLCKLGMIASCVLKEEYPNDTALVFQNASSSEVSDAQHQESIHNFPSPATFVYTLPNIVMGEISIKHEFQSENAFFVAEEFQAQFVHNYTQSLLDHKKASAAICGWLEANLDDYYLFLNYIEPHGEQIFSAATLSEKYTQ